MKTLISMMTAALLAASAQVALADDKQPTTPSVTASDASATKTRAQVRAELEEARLRGELEPAYRYGIDVSTVRVAPSRIAALSR